MHKSIFAVALLLASPATRAETNVCTNITSLPYVITSPGAYCLTQDLTLAAGPSPDWAIKIQAPDVVLDCNSFSLNGPAPVAPPAPALNLGAIRLEGSARTTVRNCRIIGFQDGIRIGISAVTLPRPIDATIEDNRVAGAAFGITGTAEGLSRVRRNSVQNTLNAGLQLVARDGVMEVAENYVSGSGIASSVEGNGGTFATAGTNPFMFVHDNVFSEIVSPAGAGPLAAVSIAAGARAKFEHNVVSSPSNPADQGAATQGVNVDVSASVTCRQNVIVGYGGAPNNPGCLGADNRIY